MEPATTYVSLEMIYYGGQEDLHKNRLLMAEEVHDRRRIIKTFY